MPLPVGFSSLIEAHLTPMTQVLPTEVLYGHIGSPVVGSNAMFSTTSVDPPPPPPPAPKLYGPEMIDSLVPMLYSSTSAVKYQASFFSLPVFFPNHRPFALVFKASSIKGRAVSLSNLLSNT